MTDAGVDSPWFDVDNGTGPLTWQVWAGELERSSVLTAAGARVMREAVAEVSTFLGPRWLEHHRHLLRADVPELPLMSLRWWPGNDSEHVYLRLLAFALRLRLLRQAKVPGLVALRKDTRAEVGHFAHGQVQLEVAALAMAGGWATRLEPPSSAAGGRKVDLLLSREGDSMAVEVKTFNVDSLMRVDSSFNEQMHRRMLFLSAEHGVQDDGHVCAPDSDADRERLLAWVGGQLSDAVRRVRSSGCDEDVVPPTGGHLTLVPDEARSGCSWSMPVRTRDPLARLLAHIGSKAEQGAEHRPLWLRMDQTQYFFHQLIPAAEPDRTRARDELVRILERKLAPYRHVAGLVLSSEPTSTSDRDVAVTATLPGGARTVSATTQPPFYRSTLIVQGPLRAGLRAQREAWQAMYLHEGRWLDWALWRAGLPPVRALVAATQ